MLILEPDVNHGSFGEVFKGSFRGESVAIKRIDMKRGKRPAILKEATIHEKIAHKNIVKYIGTYYMNRTHMFFVTEFIEGHNMEDIIYLLSDEQVDMPHRKVDFAVCRRV